MSLLLTEKGGIFTETVFFLSSPPFDVDENISSALQLKKKKKQEACAHVPVISYTMKEWGGKNERIEKIIQDVLGRNDSFPTENTLLACGNRILDQSGRFSFQWVLPVRSRKPSIVPLPSSFNYAGASVSLVGCPADQNLTCLTDPPCHSK